MIRINGSARKTFFQRSLLLLFLSTILLSSCATVEEPQGRLTAEQRQLNVDSFDYIWEKVRDTHWDPEMGGVDWNAAREKFRPEVAAASTMDEAREAMQELLDKLEISHQSIIPSELYSDIEPREDETEKPDESGDQEEAVDADVGIDLRVLDGHAIVTSVREGSFAAEEGIEPGWKIVNVDSWAVEPAIESITESFLDTTYLDLILATSVKNRLDGETGDRVELLLKDGEGVVREFDIELKEKRGWVHSVGHLPEVRVWIDTDTLEGEVGYITFNLFLDPVHLMPVFNNTMRSFQDAPGVILDLRGNGGGLGYMAMGMAGWFVDEKNLYLGKLITRDNTMKLIVNPRPDSFKGPLAILVDGLSVSAAEFLAGGLKDLGRARVFGSSTAAAALPSIIEMLPNGDGFQYVIGNYVSAAGEPLEGAGVTPHVEMRPSRDSLLKGEDAVVNAALEWILEGEPPMDEKERELQRESYEIVWKIVKERYWDPGLEGVEWDAAREKYRPGMERAVTKSDAREVIRELLSEMGGSHFGIIPEDDFTESYGDPGFDLRILDGRAVVTDVRKATPASAEGVKPGWEIISVKGERVDQTLSKIENQGPETLHTRSDKVYSVLDLFSGDVGERIVVKFSGEKGEIYLLEIELTEPEGKLAASPGDLPPQHVWLKSELLEGKFGYVRFNIFEDMSYTMKAFNDAMDSFLATEGVIIDLRGNGGGLGSMAQWMAAWFVREKGKSLGRMIERDGEINFIVLPRMQIYGGPLVILVDELTASTAEVLAGGLKELGRAEIVGVPSAGASQPSDVMKLPSGDRFKFVVARHLTISGEDVEGEGVIPDIDANHDRNLLLQGRDGMVEAALLRLHTLAGNKEE